MATKLLIEPLIDGKPHGNAIQSKKFSFDLRVTNCGTDPSEEFTISSIGMKSAEGQDINEDFGRRQFFVGIINPGESEILKIGDTGQAMYGLIAINIRVTPKAAGINIQFLQKNAFTSEKTELSALNHWVDFFYIQSVNNHIQAQTNTRIFWLTVIMAFFALVQIIPILKQLLDFFFKA